MSRKQHNRVVEKKIIKAEAEVKTDNWKRNNEGKNGSKVKKSTLSIPMDCSMGWRSEVSEAQLKNPVSTV